MADRTDRRLALEGAPNFRDMGGYEAASGACVRPGVLYRSGALARLTEADVTALNGLGLAGCIDLRTEAERAAAPTPAALRAAAAMFQLSIGTAEGVNGIPRPRLLTEPDATPEQARAAVRDSYRRFALTYTERFAALFDILIDGAPGPVVIHCTAGKDRTGIAAALVLLALGVERDAVIEDYCLTARYLDPEWRERMIVAMLGGAARVNRSVADVVFDAHPDYLDAALSVIDERFGSAERYLRDALGLDAARIDRLRTAYLV